MNGKLCVILPRADGRTVTYSFQPVTEWRLTQEPKQNGKATAPTEASSSDRARHALDVLLGVVADARHRIAAE